MRTQWDEKVAKALKKKNQETEYAAMSEDKGRHSWSAAHPAYMGTSLARIRDGEEVIPMDKEILKQYIDACELVKEAKEDIRKLKKNRKRIEQDRVTGSAHEFPYTKKSYHIEGLAYPIVKDPDELDRREEILKTRIQNAERIKREVDAWMLTIPQRMQRIIRYRIFEELPWGEVAIKMGRRATADSVKKEYQRFMDEK